MRRIRLALLLAGALALAMAPSIAHAAPGYVTSQPASGAEMDEAPEEVRVVFNQPLDPSSSLIVIDECRRRIDDNDVVVAGNTISVGISKTPSGEYKALYRVLAPQGVGGTAGGEIPFTVTSGERCGPVAKTDHDGHGEHTDDGGGSHDGHDGHGSTDGHDDHGAPASDHSSHTGHDGTVVLAAGHDHSTSSVDHGEHGVEHKGHGKSTGRNDANDSDDQVAASGPSFASPLDDAVEAVGGSAVLGALLASLVLGAAGGWIVRTMNI